MNIRIAIESDIDQLCEIGKTTFVETYGDQNTPENLRNYLQEKFNKKRFKSGVFL